MSMRFMNCLDAITVWSVNRSCLAEAGRYSESESEKLHGWYCVPFSPGKSAATVSNPLFSNMRAEGR